MSSGVNINIDGANPIKYFVVQSSQVQAFLVRFCSINHKLHMIDGAKPEIEGVNLEIDGAKCQVVEYFKSSQGKYSLFQSNLV